MTPGQIAYNAYCRSVEWKSVKGDPLPQYEDQLVRLKVAWEAAAEALKRELGDQMLAKLEDLAVTLKRIEERQIAVRQELKEQESPVVGSFGSTEG